MSLLPVAFSRVTGREARVLGRSHWRARGRCRRGEWSEARWGSPYLLRRGKGESGRGGEGRRRCVNGGVRG